MRPKPTEAVVQFRATNQAHVNMVFGASGATMAEAAVRALIEVEEPMSGHRDWVLGEITALVEYRGTTYAKPGDVVLLSQDAAGVVSFYSVRESHLCVAGAGVKPIMGWDEAFAYWRKKAGKDPATWITTDPSEDDDILSPAEPWLPPPLEDSEETDA